MLVVWEVTVVTILADSYVYVATAAVQRGEVVELAAAMKCEKDAEIPPAYRFRSIAMETLDSKNDSASRLFEDLGHRISDVSDDNRDGSCICRR